MKNNLLDIPVSYSEIQQYEPMIYKFIRQEVLQYWSANKMICKEDIIPRLGMSVDDLLQYGREVVLEQIRWYKKYGDSRKAKLTTTIFTRLRNRFISLSAGFGANKRGGNILNVSSNRIIIQNFIDNFDYKISIEENKKLLDVAILRSNSLKKHFNKTFKTNASLLRFLNHVLQTLSVIQFVDLGSPTGIMLMSSVPNPEEYLLIKEHISQILAKGIPYKKVHSSGLMPRLLLLAKERGIQSNKEIAELLNVKQLALMKVLYCQTQASKRLQDRMEQTFGKSFRELTSLVRIKEERTE